MTNATTPYICVFAPRYSEHPQTEENSAGEWPREAIYRDELRQMWQAQALVSRQPINDCV